MIFIFILKPVEIRLFMKVKWVMNIVGQVYWEISNVYKYCIIYKFI